MLAGGFEGLTLPESDFLVLFNEWHDLIEEEKKSLGFDLSEPLPASAIMSPKANSRASLANPRASLTPSSSLSIDEVEAEMQAVEEELEKKAKESRNAAAGVMRRQSTIEALLTPKMAKGGEGEGAEGVAKKFVSLHRVTAPLPVRSLAAMHW